MENEGYIVAKGLIDGKTDSQKNVFGAFLAVGSQLDAKYAVSLFSCEPFDCDMPWRDLLSVIETGKRAERDDSLVSMELLLERYLVESPALTASVKNKDSRMLEHNVNRFCADKLDLRSVTMVESLDATEGELAMICLLDEAETAEMPAEDSVDELEQENGSSAKKDELFIAFEPVLDPVGGVPVSDLAIGEIIVCRLPEDSSYNRFFENRIPGFNGIISGEIAGISMLESGMALLNVKVEDGMMGVLRLSKKVRIKLLARAKQSDGKPSRGFLFGAACVVILLGVVLLLLRYL